MMIDGMYIMIALISGALGFFLHAWTVKRRLVMEQERIALELSARSLAPLQQRLDGFQAQMAEVVKAGTTERLSLKYSIDSVIEMSHKLAEETRNLKQALKGDIKKQGAWGELILERILESSGLRKEHEYVVQGAGLSLQQEQGGKVRPDVIVHLPEKRHIIIDAKMPFVHYEAYHKASTEEEQKKQLNALLSAVQNHMKSLSEKRYELLSDLKTPQFVLLFIPIEAIFSLVMEASPGLFEEAWKRSIILTSPANLLAILRTIESLWKIERQTIHTQKIAEEGAALYDQIVDFVKEMEGVGKGLHSAQELFDKAKQRLSTGRGNILRRVENLQKLGLKTKRQLPQEYVDMQE